MTSTIALAFFIVGALAALIAVPLGYPGALLTTLMAFLYSILDDFRAERSDWPVLATLVVLMIVSFLFDWGSRHYSNGNRKGFDKPVTASVVGGFLGLLLTSPFSIYWIVAGLVVGIFLGSYLYFFISMKDYQQAIRQSVSASFSRVTTLFAKTMLSLVMTIYLLIHIL